MQNRPEKTLVEIALYAAVTAALGLIPPIPFLSGVPITAQTLGVMLAGVMLGPLRGFSSMTLFLLAVALGAPLLAGGRGGLGVFAGPTAGFALGFPFAAMATGWTAWQLRRLPFIPAMLIAALSGGIIVEYLFGITGFMLVTGKELLTSAGIMLVYIPGDLVKVGLTAVIAREIYRAMPAAIRTR